MTVGKKFTSHADLMDYSRSNSEALKLIQAGDSDYVAARCLLLNHLIFEGLRVGAQAVEKYSKAYLVLKLDRSIKDLRKKYGHSIARLSADCETHGCVFLSGQEKIIESMEKAYMYRYPDNKVGSLSGSTTDLEAIDKIMVSFYNSFVHSDGTPLSHQWIACTTIVARIIENEQAKQKFGREAVLVSQHNQELMALMDQFKKARADFDLAVAAGG